MTTEPSEAPVSVFVSSVMSGDQMKAGRRLSVETIRGLGMRAWAFEYTPPSPDDAISSYLAKVADAEIFLWLVADKTTGPVESEVAEAIRLSKKILVLRIRSAAVDARTSRLVEQLQQIAKYCTVDAVDDVATTLQQALRDVIARSVRQDPGPRPAQELSRLDAHLRALALARWEALGVANSVSEPWWADSSIGRLSLLLEPGGSQPIVLLSGEPGAGKSLAAIRFMAAAVMRRRSEPAAAVPIWVNVADRESLNVAAARATSVDDPARVGVVMVADGVDEFGPNVFRRFLDEARVVKNQFPGALVLLTARAAPGEQERHGIVCHEIPLLNDGAALAMMKSAFGVTVTPWALAEWGPIREVIKLPLFALLAGRYLAQQNGRGPRSVGDLMNTLASEGRFTEPEGNATYQALLRLAVALLDAGELSAPRAGIASSFEAGRMVATRLVRQEGDRLSFMLPVLREWYGAKAIEDGVAAFDEIARTDDGLERWRYALYSLVAGAGRPLVDRTLDVLFRVSPGFASELISHSTRADWYLDRTEVGDPQALISSFLTAWRSSREGFSTIAPLLAPHDDHEAGLPEVDLRNGSLLVRFGDDGSRLLRGDRWISTATASGEPIWPWLRIREQVRLDLRQIVHDRALQVGTLEQEEAWVVALALLGRGNLSCGDLDGAELRARLALETHEVAWGPGSRLLPLGALRKWAATGLEKLACPYSGRDRSGGSFVWSDFSPPRLLERARLVYETAQAAYAELVGTYLGSLAPRMEHLALRPFEFVGHVVPEGESGPDMWSYRVPLPFGEATRVRLELIAALPDGMDTQLDVIGALLQERRPNLPWLHPSYSTGGLEIYGPTPATDLVYRWLESDLRLRVLNLV